MTRLILAAATLCLLAVATPATTTRRSSTRDLVSLAERICCGRVESVEARLDPATGLVFTHIRLRLLDDIKGRSPEPVIGLRLIGGRAGRQVTEVAGMPSFRTGRECVLFLGPKNPLGYPVLVQAAFGVFYLETDKRGRRHLARAVSGLPGLDPRGRVSLEEFRKSVRRVLRESRRAVR